MRKNLSLFLVALMTVVTGAWAQDPTFTINSHTDDNVTFKVGDADFVGYSMDGIAKGTTVSLTPKEAYAFKSFTVLPNADAQISGGSSYYYGPFYGRPNYGYQKSELVISADYLVALKDKKIATMQFPLYSVSDNYNSLPSVKVKVFLKEVEVTKVSEFQGTEGATVVYEGNLVINNNNLEVAFETPFEYKGGNLLLGFYITQPASDNCYIRFRSTNLGGSNYIGVYGYNQESLDNISWTNSTRYLPNVNFYTVDNIPAVTIGEDGSRSFAMPGANVNVNYEAKRDITKNVSYELTKTIFSNDNINNMTNYFSAKDEIDPENIIYLYGWDFSVSLEDADGNSFGNGAPAGKYTAVFTHPNYAGEIRISDITIVGQFFVYNIYDTDKIIYQVNGKDADITGDNRIGNLKKDDKFSATPKEGYFFKSFKVMPNNLQHFGSGSWQTQTNAVPYNSVQMNAYQKNEFVIPAIEGMKDKKIAQMYFNYYNASWGNQNAVSCKIFMKEVEGTTISEFNGPAGATVVYEGPLTFDTFTFDTPFDYKGGNLLVGFYITKPVEEPTFNINYIGYNAEGASISGSSTESLDAITVGTQTGLLPNMGFYASDAIVEVVKGEDGSYSFTMPESNQNLNYTIYRDMTVKMKVTLNNGYNDVYNYDVNNPYYGFPGVTVYDVRDEDNPQWIWDGNYTLTYEDAEGNEVEQNANHEAGKYVAVIKGRNENGYDGEIRFEFEIFNAYDVNTNIAAGEYVTYFQNANLKVAPKDAENIEIYAITAVGETAVTVQKVNVISAETPMLLFNKGENNVWPTLVVTTEKADAVQSAPEFKGSLEGETFTLDEVNEFNFYIFNGVDFVKVNTAGTIAANRCWLQVAKSAAAAPRLQIGVADFDNLTGIDVAKATDVQNGQIYDMQGRKVTNAKKGLYILNGKKVVIK